MKFGDMVVYNGGSEEYDVPRGKPMKVYKCGFTEALMINLAYIRVEDYDMFDVIGEYGSSEGAVRNVCMFS